MKHFYFLNKTNFEKITFPLNLLGKCINALTKSIFAFLIVFSCIINGYSSSNFAIPPNATNPVDNEYCEGSATTSISVDDPGVNLTIEWFNDETGGTAIFTGVSFTPTVTGTYWAEVVETIAPFDRSTSRVSATLTMIPLPTTFNVTGGGSYCEGAVVAQAIGLSGSQNGVSYTLIRNGSTNVQTVPGTGSPLNFTAQTTVGTYTVQAAAGTCTAIMNGNAVVSTLSLPAANNQTPSVESDTPGGSTATVNLTLLNSSINPGAVTITWYSDLSPLTLIASPTSYLISEGVYVFAIVDNGNCTNTAQVVYDINSKPTLTTPLPSPTYVEDQVTPISINLNSYFDDTEDPNNLTYTYSMSVSGILTVSIPSNVLSINLIPNQSGSTTITIRATDSGGAFIEDDLDITVNAENDIPTFDIQPSHTSNENDPTQTVTGFAFNVNDGDLEEVQTITFNVANTPTTTTGNLEFEVYPTITLAGNLGTLSYKALANTNGSATINVYISDETSMPGQVGKISVTKSFTINVTGVNGTPSFTLNGNPPSVNEDSGPVTEPAFALNIDDGDDELTQPLTFNITFVSGSLQFTSAPAINVPLGATSANLTYTPLANSNGSATYSARLTDGDKTSPATNFIITVNPVNDPPTGGDRVKAINEDVTYTFMNSDFTFSDIDGHLFSGIQIVSEETDGELKYNGTDVSIGLDCPNVSLLTYTPTQNENNNTQSPYATFRFKVKDSSGDVSIDGAGDYTYTINVNPINDTPTSGPAAVSTLENTAYEFRVSDFPFSDVDGHTFNGIRIRSTDFIGSLTYDGNPVSLNFYAADVTKLVYTPLSNENGSPYTSFDFQVRDSQNSYSQSNYEMSISVGAINDRPTGGNGNVTTLEDVPHTFSAGDFIFNDVDGHQFAGIQIITIETSGDLEYNGVDVAPLTLCPNISQLVFKPISNENGTPYATFTFKVRDNSGSFDLSLADYTMTINVTAVNDPPSFTINGNPPAVNEGVGVQTVNNFATSINDGDPGIGEVQALNFILSIESTTGNLAFNSNPDIDDSGILTYNPKNNTNGIALISVLLQDNGGGQNTSTESQFTITVNNINDPPTLDPIADPAAINEDALIQTINLSGITAGTNESQTLTVSATSSDIGLIPNPTVIYTSANPTGQVTYIPVENENGTATITVTVNDGEVSNNTITRTFDVVVNAVNDPPTINPIADPIAIPENAGEQSITISGISPGGGPDEAYPTQAVVVTASSSNPTLIPNPVTVDYENNSTGQVKYTSSLDQNGSAVITVTLSDGQATNSTTTETFTVNVSSVNNPPTLNDIPDPAPIDEDAAPQIISLSGITAGGGESQVLSITATSDNTTLIPDENITITYTSPNPTGTLTFYSAANQFGTTTITVTIDDAGDENNTFQKTFTVTINAVADTPLVTDATANGDNQTTEGLVITSNPVDGPEVSHFKITNILTGLLYKNDGSSLISDGEFISISEGENGLKFTPTVGSTVEGSFEIQAATGNDDTKLGGEIVTATIFRNNFPVSNGFAPMTVNEDSIISSIDLNNVFDDPDNDDSELTYTVITNTNSGLFDSLVISENLFSIYLALNEFGNAEVTIQATDPNGAFTSDILLITVLPVNDPPFLETPPVRLGNQDLLYEYIIIFTDPENQAITIEPLLIPDWLSFENISSDSARIFGTPTDEHAEIQHNVSFYAFDSEFDSLLVPFEIYVQNENDPPYFIGKADTLGEVGDFYDYRARADDPDTDLGDVLSFTVELLDGSDSFLNYRDNKDGTVTIFGTPQSGTVGFYRIRIIVKDLALDSAELVYTLNIKEANSEPTLSRIQISTDEDIPFYFTADLFKSHYNDLEGDTLQNIKFSSLPFAGSLLLNGSLIEENDTIEYNDIENIEYRPKLNEHGFEFFKWNAYDGSDYATIPGDITVNINSIKDPPELIDFEQNSILFEFANTDGAILTESEVFDGDGDNIEKATITFIENYLKGQDSLYYDLLAAPDLTYIWEDSAGVLTIRGLRNPKDYTAAIDSIRYINTNPLAPSVEIRTIEIILYDADNEVSIPYLRQIEFENTFVDLIIPTGITPNDDGVNDTWVIENIDRYEDVRVSVYSRSGQLLFDSIGYGEEWDGTNNGEVLPPGPYYFAISINKYQRNYSGTITILR